MMGFGDAVASAGQSVPRSTQITTPTPHHSIFTVTMLVVTPNQQCNLRTEGTEDNKISR